MTRVPKAWLGANCKVSDDGEGGPKVIAVRMGDSRTTRDVIKAAHLPHHLGVERTLYLAKKISGTVSRRQVQEALSQCEPCQRIDPSLRVESRVEKGSLSVESNWERLAIDVTHYRKAVYLLLIDCGPSHCCASSSEI